jgi:HNH endonuclease
MEHIVPKVVGGSDEPDNLALACQGCNNFKFTKVKVFDKETNSEMPFSIHVKIYGRNILCGTIILQ